MIIVKMPFLNGEYTFTYIAFKEQLKLIFARYSNPPIYQALIYHVPQFTVHPSFPSKFQQKIIFFRFNNLIF